MTTSKNSGGKDYLSFYEHCNIGGPDNLSQKRSKTKMLIMDEIFIQESIFFNSFNYYTKIYCMITANKIMYYYDNKNNYYLNEGNYRGFINLSNNFTLIKPFSENNDEFIIELKKPSKKIYKFKCFNTKQRDKWLNVLNEIQFQDV